MYFSGHSDITQKGEIRKNALYKQGSSK